MCQYRYHSYNSRTGKKKEEEKRTEKTFSTSHVLTPAPCADFISSFTTLLYFLFLFFLVFCCFVSEIIYHFAVVLSEIIYHFAVCECNYCQLGCWLCTPRD